MIFRELELLEQQLAPRVDDIHVLDFRSVKLTSLGEINTAVYLSRVSPSALSEDGSEYLKNCEVKEFVRELIDENLVHSFDLACDLIDNKTDKIYFKPLNVSDSVVRNLYREVNEVFPIIPSVEKIIFKLASIRSVDSPSHHCSSLYFMCLKNRKGIFERASFYYNLTNVPIYPDDERVFMEDFFRQEIFNKAPEDIKKIYTSIREFVDESHAALKLVGIDVGNDSSIKQKLYFYVLDEEKTIDDLLDVDYFSTELKRNLYEVTSDPRVSKKYCLKCFYITKVDGDQFNLNLYFLPRE